MCGIVGYLERGARRDAFESDALVKKMAGAIAHRGPDADGAWVDSASAVALGHRRLSIIDLSPAGAQPMQSKDGRWTLIFNGEIYNFEEMRSALEAERGAGNWRGHSDTEVLLECMSAWGFEKSLKQTNGMFAFAVWDAAERCLYLARDRMGEKPLYYGWQGGAFLFGSELKSLAVHPSFGRRLNPAAVQAYLTFGYVPAPFSIYAGVQQLKPGHHLRIEQECRPGELPEPVAFWSIPVPKPNGHHEAESIEELDALLRDAVRLRMRADVPMGAFLSGGIDSSTIVGMMQAQSNKPIRTFSIGFHEAEYDESRHAAAVAKHLGTAHTDLHVTAQDALDVVPMLPDLFDEPFSDSSQIPTFLLSKLTRQQVIVSLSGDGGDEVFGGYSRYFAFGTLWNKIAFVPGPLRSAIGKAIGAVPGAAWNAVPKVLPLGIFREVRSQRMKRLSEAVGSRDEQQFYRYLMSFWYDGKIMKHPTSVGGLFFDRFNIKNDFADPVLGMSFVDMGSYLPDDILVKVDRAGMAVSLEGRIPILDHRVVEFAAGLPLDLKVRNSQGKWILRKVLDRYVPRELVDRPKQGFGIPLEQWLRGTLKDWADDLLYDRNSVLRDVLDLAPVHEIWEEHKSGRTNECYRLWTVLMLMAWARKWNPT